MSKRKSLGALLAVLVLASSFSSIAFAQEPVEHIPQEVEEQEIEFTPYWNYVFTITNNVSVSGGVAYCRTYASATSSTTKIRIEQVLYKRSGLTYKYVKTWNEYFNGSSGTAYNEYAGGSGSYRLDTNVYIYQGNVLKERASSSNYS